MSQGQGIIVTTTRTQDPGSDYRFQLVRQMCQTGKAFNYPICIVDGSPDHETAKELLLAAGASIVELQHTPGMGASRRQCLALGLAEAGESGVMAWFEPEKVAMIPCLEGCIAMVRHGYDIVVTWRNRLFADYPPYQALSEARANQEMAEVTGLNLDLMSGPRIMSRRGAELLASYTGQSRVDPNVLYNDDWGIIFVPILWALKDGLKVGSCPVEYVHPQIQTALESRMPAMDRRRDVQRTELVAAMRQEAELIGLTRAA